MNTPFNHYINQTLDTHRQAHGWTKTRLCTEATHHGWHNGYPNMITRYNNTVAWTAEELTPFAAAFGLRASQIIAEAEHLFASERASLARKEN